MFTKSLSRRASTFIALPVLLLLMTLSVSASTMTVSSLPEPERDPALTKDMQNFDLAKPVPDWTDHDIEVFVSLLYAQDTLNEQIGPDVTVDTLMTIMTQFNADQGRAFESALTILLKQIDEQHDVVIETPSTKHTRDYTASSTYWTQNIEHTGLTAGPSVYPDFAYDSWYTCDADPDLDIIFNFTFNSDNPDGLRWDSSSVAFVAAIGVSNGFPYTNFDLKGFGYISSNSVSLCTPSAAVTIGGGSTAMLGKILVGWD